MKNRSRIVLWPLIGITLIVSVGCGSLAVKQKERQMELVARDWSMTIRASQVVPVYPLTQDIQPGDVFLVNQTVAEQSRRFRDRGFLPTDLLVTRLKPLDYAGFYSMREAAGGDGVSLVLPGHWRDRPAPSVPWERFPRAGFPSYTFEVSNDGGFSIAVPVHSVPVALSLTGAARATGSITIVDASTYGLDAATMYRELQAAAQRGDLDEARPPMGHGPWYLRVVTRVFAAKSFDVVLTARDTMAGGADVGAPQPLADSAAQLDRGQAIETINDQLAQSEAVLEAAGIRPPGGSIRATFTNGRTIGLRETFTEPIVVGYHGFDVAIDSDGNIGSIIPTFQVLDDALAPLPPTATTTDDSAYMAMIELLRGLPTSESREILMVAARNSGRFKPAFERESRARPGNPVGAWVTVTTHQAGIDELSGWVSRAIREVDE